MPCHCTVGTGGVARRRHPVTPEVRQRHLALRRVVCLHSRVLCCPWSCSCYDRATFHALQHSKRFLGVPASSASSKSVVGMAGHNRVAPSVVIQVESDSKRSLEDGGGVEEAKNNGDHVTVLDAVGERESKGTPGPPPATASPPPQDSPGVSPQRPGSPSQPAHMPGAVHVPGTGAGAAALADPVGSPHSTTSPADPLLAAPTGDGRNRLPPAVP